MSNLEIWKPVVGYENYYEVSSIGRVRSLPREVKFINGSTRKLNGKILKPMVSQYGYEYVMLAYNGKQTSKFIHRIVAETFLCKSDDSSEVNHIDGDKHNNHVDNLDWVTHKQNIQHSFAIGLHKIPPSEHMRQIGKIGNKISTDRASMPVLCVTDNIAFVSQRAADRYYGYRLGSVRDVISKRHGKFKGKLFRKLSDDERHNFTLLS